METESGFLDCDTARRKGRQQLRRTYHHRATSRLYTRTWTSRLGRALLGAALLLWAATAAASGADAPGADAPFDLNSFDKTPTPAALTAIGRALFFDPGLSASGSLACASCHDPAHAFAAPNARAVQRGGADRGQPGVRAVPSLMYEQNMPPFTEHFFDSGEGDDGVDQGPAGELCGTGAHSPGTNRHACRCCRNSRWPTRRPDDIVVKVAHAPYAAQFRRAFGRERIR